MAEQNNNQAEADDLSRRLHGLWKRRIERGQKAMGEKLRNGRELLKFIEGSQWVTGEDQQVPDSQYSKTTTNKMHTLVNGILANTVYQRPTVTAKPLRKGDDAVNRAIVNSSYLRYCMRECKYEQHQYLAAYDAAVYGFGFTEEDVDYERGGIARSQWRSAEDVVVDPAANTLIESCGWVAIRFTMNVNTARRVFKEPDLQADSSTDTEKRAASSHVGGGAQEDQRVTLWRIWARGDDPDVNDADLKDRDNKPADAEGDKGSELDRYLRRHGNRRYILCEKYPKILDERPWPFVLDHDDFPVTIWTVHRVPGQMLPWSWLNPVRELQRHINWATTFLITQMRRTSQRKYLLNKQMFDGGQDEIDKLTSLEADEVILTSGNLDQALRELDLGQLSAQALTGLQVLNQQFDEISGYQELFGPMAGARSAREAQIREDRAQTNTSLMLQCIEASMTRSCRHMLQIGFAVTPAALVAEMLGEDVVGVTKDPMTGAEIAAYWNEDMTPRQIRAEVDVALEPGSTRRVNREQAVQDAVNLMDRSLGVMAQLTAAGMRPEPVAIMKYVNWFMRKIADELGWQDLEQALIPGEALGIIEEPPPAPTTTYNYKQGNTTYQDARKFEDARSFTLDEPNPSLTIHNKAAVPPA